MSPVSTQGMGTASRAVVCGQRERGHKLHAMSALLFLALYSLAPAAPAFAQASVSATVDRTEVALDDQLTLSIAVQSSQDVGQPSLPTLPDFDVLSQSSSQSLNITGAGSSISMTYEYVLRPRSQGTKTIPPVEVPVGRRVLRTRPVTVRVLPASGASHAPSAGSSGTPELAPFLPPEEAEGDLIARCDVDKKRAYVGEQIILTFSLLYSGPLQGVQYQPPKTEGFRTEELPAPAARYETVNGRRYITRQDLRALFPTAPGRLTIGAATVQYSKGYWEPVPGTVTTRPITIEVLRLPDAGRPESFSGVVGHLNVRASLDRTAVKRGEAATLTAVVNGWGNLDAMKPPVVSLPPGLRKYNSTENREFGPEPFNDSYRMEGKALFDTVIVPTTVGDLTIPPIAVAYFDPNTATYDVARGEPVVLHVEPGAGGELPGAAVSVAGQLKPLPNRLASQGSDVLLSAPVALAHLAAIGWLVSAGVVRWRRSVLARDPRLARRRGAADRALRQIKVASGLPLREAAAQVASALAGYVADQLDVPPATVSAASVESLLTEAGVSAGTASVAARLLRDWDAARFAPAAASSPMADRATDLLRHLEGELRLGRRSRGEGGVR